MTTDSHPPRDLHIEADLTVGLASSTLRIHSTDTVLYVDARSVAALRELRAAAETKPVDALRTLGIESSFAIETPIVIRVRGIPVAATRPGKPVGRLAEWLGTTPFSPKPWGIVRAVGRTFLTRE